GHLDHILGLGGLLSTFSRWEAIDDLHIYAGKWALERIHDLIYGVVLRGAREPIPIQMHQLQPGVFFETDDFTIHAVYDLELRPVFRIPFRGKIKASVSARKS
ncbi:hypothetical protein ACFLXB_02590, partial [Chloroflexota bacterium]